MSDQIPIGSPPAPAGRHAAPSGWYPDPADAAQERYWDGWQWSRQTRPSSAPSAPRPGAGPMGAPPPLPGPSRAPGGQRIQATHTADGVALAGWWHRFGAVLIDWLVLGVVQLIVLAPIMIPAGERAQAAFGQIFAEARAGRQPPEIDPSAIYSTSDQVIITLVSVLLTAAYHVLMLRFRGATLGKLATGLRVVPVDAGHAPRPLPWQASIVRTLIWVAPALSGCLALLTVVDGLLPLWQRRRQALHDLLASTQVIRTR